MRSEIVKTVKVFSERWLLSKWPKLENVPSTIMGADERTLLEIVQTHYLFGKMWYETFNLVEVHTGKEKTKFSFIKIELQQNVYDFCYCLDLI